MREKRDDNGFPEYPFDKAYEDIKNKRGSSYYVHLLINKYPLQILGVFAFLAGILILLVLL
jgi:hypothetical protein